MSETTQAPKENPALPLAWMKKDTDTKKVLQPPSKGRRDIASSQNTQHSERVDSEKRKMTLYVQCKKEKIANAKERR
jgi:hypothetical protein